MRLAYERRRASEIGIADRYNDLGAMVDTIAPEVFCGIAVKRIAVEWLWNGYS